MMPQGSEAPLQLARPVAMQPPEGWDYLKPVGNFLLANMVYWVGSRYLLNNDYSYISPATIVDNFWQGFGWDDDVFGTNQFGHPYQGAGYHSGARAVGFSFWGALPYTLMGSLHWELFMENTRPSYNDVITTSVGGVALGEVLFRLSSALLDPTSRGAQRALREGGALVVNPVYGLARLASGEATRQAPAGPQQPVAFRFALGLNDFNSSDLGGSMRNIGLELGVIYGDFADDGQPFLPFDWFMVEAGFNYRSSDFYTADFDLSGLLARWGWGCGSGNQCVWGPSMHYDFHHTPVFDVGTSAVGVTGLGRFQSGWGGLKLLAGLDLQFVTLGGVDSPYVEAATGQTYNLGVGGYGRAMLGLSKPGWFQLSGFGSRYFLRIVKGVAGYEVVGISGVELALPIRWGLGVAAGLMRYNRLGVSDDYPKIDRTDYAQEVQIYWRL